MSAWFALILIVLDIRSYYMFNLFASARERGNDEQSFIHKT